MRKRHRKNNPLIGWLLAVLIVLVLLSRLPLDSLLDIQPDPIEEGQGSRLIPKTTQESIPQSNGDENNDQFQVDSFRIWFSPLLPQNLSEMIILAPGDTSVKQLSDANILIQLGEGKTTIDWIYVLVAPFPTITDNMDSLDLMYFWRSGTSEEVDSIVMSGSTHAVLKNMWGMSSQNVKVHPESQLLKIAWENPKTWAVIPFEKLEPKWKVIAINGHSPIQKGFTPGVYPLTIPISVVGSQEDLDRFSQKYLDDLSEYLIPKSNRSEDKLTTVLLTGVTALVRGTADMMELRGMTYPAEEIRDILIEADITHINNEVPFTPKCPASGLRESNESLVFCSRPEYIELLEDIGTDIVEMSGDHLQDWGPEAVDYTLDLYDERGWKYYGGGRNIEDGRKPLLMEHNGNKIAFLGCNGKDKGYSGATDILPGAVSCDFDYLDSEIRELIKSGYLPIVTFQHREIWRYDPPISLKEDFYKVAKSGAVIVSGSQAHQPQTMEFFDGSFLHFGLGNLFFDQYFEGFPNRKAFLDRHIIYNGKHISTELITLMFVDLAKSRLMTSGERDALLNLIFIESAWQ